MGSVNDQEIKQLTGACSTTSKSGGGGIAPIICRPQTKTKEPLTIGGYTIRLMESPATTTAAIGVGGGRYNIGGGGGPLEQQKQQRNEKSPSTTGQQKSFPRFI